MIAENQKWSDTLGDGADALITLRAVNVLYEDEPTPVLQDVNFELRSGETVLLLGPSGCGKSTLAMLCAGLIPGSVQARVQGDVHISPSLQSPGGVGYVFQDPEAQFCMIHADDEVAFGLENIQVRPDDMPARMVQALHDVDLDIEPSAIHAHFSGGMKQKLAMASALAMNAEVLVLDEPTANLDPESTRQVFDQIVRLHESGRTMMVIEHKFQPLLAHVDRVVLFDASGHIHRTGVPAQVMLEEWEWLLDQGILPRWQMDEMSIGPDHSVSDGPDDTQSDVVTDPRSHAPHIADAATAVRPQPSAVVLTNATARYGKQVVWDDVSITVPQGAFVAVVGPNGAGKSTLLQMMAGLGKPQEGRVELFGRPIGDYTVRERTQCVTFCFQNPEYQFIYERVADELANRVVEGETPAAVKQLLDDFGLCGMEGHSPFGLSQGQKRRLSVAAMLKEEHQLYLLDEPTFGQDARTQEVIMAKLRARNECGGTIVMTTHDMDLVRRFATHVVVLAEGGVLFSGFTPSLFSRPALMQRARLQPAADGKREQCVGQNAMDIVRPAGARLAKGLAARLNPSWLLVSVLVTVVVGMFARALPQAVAMFALAIVALMAIPRLSPWRAVKRLSPFLGFYVLYVWSLTAFGNPGGSASFNMLWMHLSIAGLMNGIVLAFRMLAAVSLGVMFVSSAEVTAVVVGLCKNMRLSPKLSYGMMAGIRVAPLFHTEWTKLRQARQLRGKDAKWAVLRPVTYALPLLTQAIRMSERVATAMEARGFVGDVTRSAENRSFYRDINVNWWDYAFACGLPGVAVMLLIFV